MILDTHVWMVLSSMNKKHYEDLGYTWERYKDSKGGLHTKNGTRILVAVSDVQKWSIVKVRVKCDNCGIERLISKVDSKFELCRKCAINKVKVIDDTERDIDLYSVKYHYRSHINAAKKRNIDNYLNIEEFETLVTNPHCHYCGGSSRDTARSRTINGVDRLDNTKSYTLDNSVTCCITCNRMKEKHKYNTFISHIRKISEHTKDYEIK